MINIFLVLIILLLFLTNCKNIEGFDRFMEPSDNYNLLNKTQFYNRLRNMIGCSNLIY